ncbi:GldM N-terminal domain-containing protein [Reichenbachiella agariperforans]|uniref:GldM N-terminal domain-containing protein n=1 Tax=Reichenbachiella agariperforans TaxID=156994 RepID=A0A1M6T521_REIAG|nr:hypothetical protein [Reichenbachiella agariperforans]SHK52034.1 GldM N-terminal domain-containing protein [Reichenbachiella agariperforans]
MRIILTLSLFLTFITSCSNDEQHRINTIILNTVSVEELNRQQIIMNDSTISFINTILPSTPVEINNTRTLILKELKTIKQELVSSSGGYDEYHNYINPLEQVRVRAFLIENGKASEIQEYVNSIISDINKQGYELPRIARDAKDIEIFRYDPNQKHKTYEEMNFANVNLIEALNVIAVNEAFILQAENKYLNWYLMQNLNKGM